MGKNSHAAVNTNVNNNENIKLETINYDRSSLLDQPIETGDCLVTFKGEKFPILKEFLTPISFYFEQIFNGEWAEENTRRVDLTIEGATVEDFKWVLRNVYGKNLAFEKQQIEGIMKVAAYLQIMPLVEKIGDIAVDSIKTSTEVLDLKIRNAILLDRLAGIMEIDNDDVLPLLELAIKTEALGLQKRCGPLLATSIDSEADIDKLASLPVVTLLELFKSNEMNLHNEDEVLDLLAKVCNISNFDVTTKQYLTSCIRLKYLTQSGLEQAIAWDVIDRTTLITVLAKDKFPNIMPEVEIESSRKFLSNNNPKFSQKLSKCVNAFEENDTTAVFHNIQNKGVSRKLAVADVICNVGDVWETTFLLPSSLDINKYGWLYLGVVSLNNIDPNGNCDAQKPYWGTCNNHVGLNNFSVVNITDIAQPNTKVGVVIDGKQKCIKFINNNKCVFTSDNIPDSRWPLCPAVWQEAIFCLFYYN